jgi:hypothetical protein
MIEIIIKSIKLLSGNKPLRGFVDIQLGDWIIRDWRLVKEDGRRLQVFPPQVSWVGQKGEIQYKTIITFPVELKGQIDFAILKRYNEEMEESSGRTRTEDT